MFGVQDGRDQLFFDMTMEQMHEYLIENGYREANVSIDDLDTNQLDPHYEWLVVRYDEKKEIIFVTRV